MELIYFVQVGYGIMLLRVLGIMLDLSDKLLQVVRKEPRAIKNMKHTKQTMFIY